MFRLIIILKMKNNEINIDLFKMKKCEYCENNSNIEVSLKINNSLIKKHFCSNCYQFEKGIKKNVKKLKKATQYENMMCDQCNNKSDICYGLGYVESAGGDVLAFCKKCFMDNF